MWPLCKHRRIIILRWGGHGGPPLQSDRDHTLVGDPHQPMDVGAPMDHCGIFLLNFSFTPRFSVGSSALGISNNRFNGFRKHPNAFAVGR
jgi:hypothetical protein